jgi:hypothetical protein
VGGLKELLAEREPVTPPRRALARAFWNAIASPDASGLTRLLAADLSAWPGLARGLRAQVQRFPDARDLSGVESTLLGLLSRGPTEMAELFPAWAQTELGGACGFGGAQVEAALRAMPALVKLAEGRIALTPEGVRVAAGEGAAPARERWIGGVHLAPGRPGWRREGDRLVRR